MNFRESTQEDITYIADHSVSRGIFKKQPDEIDFCYTLEHENEPLGIGGIRLINTTTAWCWVDLSDKAKDHIIIIYRVIKEWMDIVCKEKGIKRLQAYIEYDFPEAVRMVEHLGFHMEFVMPRFINDKSAYMYVRYTENE